MFLWSDGDVVELFVHDFCLLVYVVMDSQYSPLNAMLYHPLNIVMVAKLLLDVSLNYIALTSLNEP